MAGNNILNVRFGVFGGKSISGNSSGASIISDLSEIARQAGEKIKVKFDADTSEVKKQLDELSKNYQVTLKVKTEDVSSGKGGGSGGVTKQISAYNQLKQALTAYGKELRIQLSQVNTSSKAYKEATALLERYEQQLNELGNTKGGEISESQLGELNSLYTQAKELAEIAGSATQAAQKYKEYKAAVIELREAEVKQANSVNLTEQAQAKLNDEIERCRQKVEELKAAGGYTEEENKEIAALNAHYDTLVDQAKKYAEIASANKAAEQTQKTTKAYYDARAALSELLTRYDKWIAVSDEAAAAAEKAQGLLSKTLSTDATEAQQQVTELEEETKKISVTFSTAARESNTLGNQIKQAFDSKIVQAFYSIIKMLLVKALKDVYQTVVDIDSAMTQLQIVTKASANTMSEFAEEISAAAKSIGSSIADLTESVTTFSRLGFSLEESTQYATLIAQYAKVADTTVSEATTNMTAAIKAFNIAGDEFEEALDKLIKVGKIVAQLCSNVQKEDSYIG